MSANNISNAEDAEEIVRLRAVYECARRILRYDGIDRAEVVAAMTDLDCAVEAVKSLDSGLEDTEGAMQ